MNCYPETASVQLTLLENCEPSASEGKIVNLSSEFPISDSDRHSDMVFPSMGHMERLRQSLAEKGLEPKAFSSTEEALDTISKNKSLDDNWPCLKKAWSLNGKGKLDLSNQQLAKYARSDFDGPFDLPHVQFDFCHAMLSPGRHRLFQYPASLVGECANNFKPEYFRFKAYYETELRNDNLSRYFDIFSQYFKSYSEYSQTLIFVQHSIELSSDFHATSQAFSKTKQFYGNAFEALTSNITVLACLNNIINGRPFDEFESMNLKNYLTIDKANRANPFAKEPRLTIVSNCLESSLRNASHHGHIKLVRGTAVEYRSGGTGALHSISYSSYLEKCNEIMLACSALLQLELAVAL